MQDTDNIGAEGNETTKKRSKKANKVLRYVLLLCSYAWPSLMVCCVWLQENKDYFVPSDINHNGYASFPLHYDGFVPMYAMQHPHYPSQLQHLTFPEYNNYPSNYDT